MSYKKEQASSNAQSKSKDGSDAQSKKSSSSSGGEKAAFEEMRRESIEDPAAMRLKNYELRCKADASSLSI